MAIKYSTEYVLKRIDEACADISALYKAPLINWSGCSADGINYSEIIAGVLIGDGVVDRIIAIPEIARENYKVDAHDGKSRRKTIREEEIFAKDLFAHCSAENKSLNAIGKIIDYQVPLKASHRDSGAGKIDLVSYSESVESVYLLELKYKDNKETLMRCALEISTYFQLLHKANFLSSYPELKHLRPDAIRKGILVFEGSTQHKEIEEMLSGIRPGTRALLTVLGVEAFLIKSEYAVSTVK